MTPIPATRHVSYGYDDLAYDGGPKSESFIDRLTDQADGWADE